jgi:hypothetical protein
MYFTFLVMLIGMNATKFQKSSKSLTSAIVTMSDSASSPRSVKDEQVTPEMFGAIGDGKFRKLSTKYSTLADAKKDYPSVQDMDFTIDGAAFQKAVDYVASKGGGEVIAKKNYAINFPIEAKSNVVIDGAGVGFITNDNSRNKPVLNNAFFVGNYHGIAFGTNGFKFYKINGPVKAGQDNVKVNDAGDFKPGQIVMLCSFSKKKTNKANTELPYQITVSKIVKISGNTIFIEYPIDEDMADAEIAANGAFDPFAQIPFYGVENVTIKNFTINARGWATRWYGYKCDIENLKLINSDVLIVGSALVRSTIKNISGNFNYRCIEIKTGSYNLVVDGVNGTYKPFKGAKESRSVISIGEYNRNITVKNFTIDMGNLNIQNDAVIGISSRKNIVSNGKIYCKNHFGVVLRFFSDKAVDNEKLGCYDNKISNVDFYSNSNVKYYVFMGSDKPDEIAPSNNVVESCNFFGGSVKTAVLLNSGNSNTIRQCSFEKARLTKKQQFATNNVLDANKFK